MKRISVYRAKGVEDALRALSAGGQRAAVYAGGSDLLVRLKNRIHTAPDALVDIKRIDEMRYIRSGSSKGLEIGALVTLGELAESDLLGSYPSILQTVSLISSPELRNQSTVGGNILQEVWCPYYRGNYRCWRNGGDVCYAETGDNTEYQSIMGAKKSYAAYPGDLAVTLVALGATASIAGIGGSRELPVEELIPGEFEYGGRIQSHVLRSDEVLTGITIPPQDSNSLCMFRKVRRREVWDFATASLALRLAVEGDTILSARAVFGGVATRPWRDRRLEDYLAGKMMGNELPDSAVDETLVDARPLQHNAYKKDQAAGLVRSMLADIVKQRAEQQRPQ